MNAVTCWQDRPSRKWAPEVTKPGNASRPRGARAELPITSESIVAAAFKMIDERGLDNFSMRSLAAELGVFPTTLYWHVGDRSELLGRVEYLWIRGVEIPSPSTDWRDWARQVAHGYRRHAFRHPNIARLATLERTRSAESLKIPDAIIGHLHALGFREHLVDAFNSLMGAIRGYVIVELAPRPESTTASDIEADLRSLDTTSYPNITQHFDRFGDRALSLRWSNATDSPLDEGFNFLVEILLEGLESKRG